MEIRNLALYSVFTSSGNGRPYSVSIISTIQFHSRQVPYCNTTSPAPQCFVSTINKHFVLFALHMGYFKKWFSMHFEPYFILCFVALICTYQNLRYWWCPVEISTWTLDRVWLNIHERIRDKFLIHSCILRNLIYLCV